MRNTIKMACCISLISAIGFVFLACSNKEVNPYDALFKDTHKFVPINTKELKVVK